MNLREHEAVRLGSMTETLSVIPYLVGFHPHRSMVVVCLHGERRRSGLVMRADLPRPEAETAWATEVAARAEQQRTEGVLTVCYSDEPDRGAELARQTLVDTLSDAFAARDVGVEDAALVRQGRWWSYLCRQPTCCPAGGTAIPDVLYGPAARVGANSALNGRSPLASREALEAAVTGPTGDALEAAYEAFGRAAAEFDSRLRHAGPADLNRQIMTAVRDALTAHNTGDGRLGDDTVATICVGLEEKSTRDHVAALDVDEPAAWLALLTHLAQRTPDRAAAPICTTLAWVAYGYGDGALANVALDRALHDRPDYNMALLLRAASERQVSPVTVRDVSRHVRRSHVHVPDPDDDRHDR